MHLTARGLALPEDVRRRHLDYLAAAQSERGGFAGRKGADDLYYTGFALRAFVLLGEMKQRIAAAAAGFLRQHIVRKLSPIDFLSLVNSAVLLETTVDEIVFDGDLAEIVETRLEPLKRDDGGYAKSERSGHGSTYHSFLAVLCKQMVGCPADKPEPLIRMVRSRQRDDGGFVEIDAMRRSGTNPTAAAIGLLKALDVLDQPTGDAAAKYLVGMQTTAGGLLANTQIPVPDLLSTFTGLVALHDLDAMDKIDAAAAMRFSQSLERPSGGFRAGEWDAEPDVEYAFYGLGILAMLTEPEE